MPRIPAQARSRIFQRFELQSVRGEPHFPAVREQALAVSRDEMRHRVPFPSMAVQPQSTIHGVDHPVESASELAVRRRRFSGHAGPLGIHVPY